MSIENKCEDCKHRVQTPLWDECRTEESQYKDNNAKEQFHTTVHMRQYACGTDGRLYRRKL